MGRSMADLPWSSRRRFLTNAFSSAESHFVCSGKFGIRKKHAIDTTQVKMPSRMNWRPVSTRPEKSSQILRGNEVQSGRQTFNAERNIPETILSGKKIFCRFLAEITSR